jgi:hypothetical protein
MTTFTVAMLPLTNRPPTGLLPKAIYNLIGLPGIEFLAKTRK